MFPIKILPYVYVLQLEGDEKHPCYFYIGCTHNLHIRVAQHLEGCGAKFVRKHAVLKLYSVELVDGDALERENEVAEEFISIYGRERVRGGRHC